tara:strand:+ start:480 stop:581 length:102 start_codon:yes stop_codon:yes gene_type:complete
MIKWVIIGIVAAAFILIAFYALMLYIIMKNITE